MFVDTCMYIPARIWVYARTHPYVYVILCWLTAYSTIKGIRRVPFDNCPGWMVDFKACKFLSRALGPLIHSTCSRCGVSVEAGQTSALLSSVQRVSIRATSTSTPVLTRFLFSRTQGSPRRVRGRLRASSAAPVPPLRLRPSRLPLRSGLHRRVGLVRHAGQEADGSQQPVGTPHVRHRNLCDGEPAGPAPGPVLAPAGPSGSLRSLHLPVGVPLGLGADVPGGLSLGLLGFQVQPVWTGDPGVHVALECGSVHRRAARNQKHSEDQTAPVSGPSGGPPNFQIIREGFCVEANLDCYFYKSILLVCLFFFRHLN